MKVLKWILIPLLVIIVLAGGVVLGGHIYIKNEYGINIFSTLKQFRTLSQPVNETELVTNGFSDDDMVDVQELVNESVTDMIIYDEETGYVINFGDLDESMKAEIKLSDKQVGALAHTVIEQEFSGSVALGDKTLGVELKQIDFIKTDDGKDLLNSIIKIDLSPMLEEIPDKFPLTWLKSKIPTALYVSSTVEVVKGEQALSYFVSHSAITINNLSSADTEDMLDTLDKLISFGTAKEFNETIGMAIMDAMVGTEDHHGIVYSLSTAGASDFHFENQDGIDYFLISK